MEEEILSLGVGGAPSGSLGHQKGGLVRFPQTRLYTPLIQGPLDCLGGIIIKKISVDAQPGEGPPGLRKEDEKKEEDKNLIYFRH